MNELTDRELLMWDTISALLNLLFETHNEEAAITIMSQLRCKMREKTILH